MTKCKAGMYSQRLIESDPNFSSVVLLLHMDGANNSTTFTDSSQAANTVTAFDGAAISTAQSKFGNASGLFESPKRLEIPGSANFDLSSVDFTIEAWIYGTSLVYDGAIVARDLYGGNFSWGLYVNSTNVHFATNNFLTVRSGSTTISENQWHHVAATSSGGTLRLFLNGNELLAEATTVTNATSDVSVGCFSANNPNTFFNGYIDELRITKGVARYTAAFTPPAAPFPDS